MLSITPFDQPCTTPSVNNILEPHYTVNEVATAMKSSRWTVVRRFENYPGVIKGSLARDAHQAPVSGASYSTQRVAALPTPTTVPHELERA